MTVRTRIAPSPTGDPHVGTAYIALFNLCFARQHDGCFVLRIEDTDQARSRLDSEQLIFDSLKWLGLEWDEGPDVGGPHGPYRQSERVAIYREHAERLLEKGHAFKCYRTAEELDQIRNERREAGQSTALKFSDLALPSDEVKEREDRGDSYVIRMHVPEEGVCTFTDRLRGAIEIDWAQVDAQILLKADGMPTYHLANVVDDHLMEITHVIRGEEWISSAPKHHLLYQYFEWDMPELIHLPLLRNPDKSKLSKRKNPTSILFYQRMGFMPEALVNYLGRMGWSMPDESEKFSLEQMMKEFNIDRVNLGGPVFDMEKLRWLNGCWIREELSLEEFSERLIKSWAYNKEYLMPALKHFQERIDTYSDLAPAASFLVSGMLDITEEDFTRSSSIEHDIQLKILQYSLWQLEELHPWQRDMIFEQIKQVADAMGIKLKDFLAPVFIAIAGTTASISVMDSMALLGADMSRARLRHAIEVMGGVSKKQAKKMEKEYRGLIDSSGA
jgi:glutamyl-tRNA synthetase